MAIYDPAAATVLPCRNIGISDANVGVVLSGSERGRTVGGFQAAGEVGNAKVATDPRHAAVKQACMDALLGECEG